MSSSASYEILLIGELSSSAKSLLRLLRDAKGPSFAVQHEEDLRTALLHTASFVADVIVWDLTVSASNSLPLLEQFYSQDRAVPLLVLVSRKNEQLGKQALALGASEYVIRENLSGDLIQKSLRYLIELSRSEGAMRQWERRFGELFENTKDILFTLDLEGQITPVNKAAEEVMGWPAVKH